MNFLTTLLELFSRGLESVASFFLSGKSRASTIQDALNNHLVLSQGQVTAPAAAALGKAVERAEIAGSVITNIGEVERRSVPRAPGMNFRDPYTGNIGAYRYQVIIIPEEGTAGPRASTYVYTNTNQSYQEIVNQALEQLAEHTAFRDSLPAGISDDLISSGKFRIEIKSVYRRT